MDGLTNSAGNGLIKSAPHWPERESLRTGCWGTGYAVVGMCTSRFLMLLKALCITFSFVFVNPNNVSAEQISAKYWVNTNNWQGVLELSVSGNKVFGDAFFAFDPRGNQTQRQFRLIDGTARRGPNGTLEIQFYREGKDQKYYGWFSQDRSFIGGYFEGGYTFPWSAKRID